MTRRAGVVGIVWVALLVLAAPAWAHTGLVSSDPSDGTTIGGPVDVVTLTFNGPVELAGSGVELLDARGRPVPARARAAGTTVRLRPREPLGGGRYGVRWAVRAGDAHPVRGALSFGVDAVAAPPRNAERTAATVAAAEETRRSGDATTGAQVGRAADTGTSSASSGTLVDATAPATDLDRALAADPVANIRLADQALRAMFLAATLGAVGLLVFLLAAWDGPRREARQLIRLTGRLAALAAVVVAAQVPVRAARTGGGWSSTLDGLASTMTGSYAAGMALRMLGLVVLIAGLGSLRHALCSAAMPIAGAAVDLSTPVARAEKSPPLSFGRRTAAAPASVVGALLLLASFAAVGHAATAEPRAVAVGAIIVHVSAAAAWAGGLVGLTVVAWSRYRAGRRLGVGMTVARFSVVAAVGVTGAAAAGVALAVVRLDSVSALWASSYGRVLLAKIAVVGIVAAMGAYNHYVVVPALHRDAGSHLGRRLRWLGLVEVGLLVAVVALTSILVGVAR